MSVLPSKPRSWEVRDLWNRKAHLRAIPILVLEKWEHEGERAQGVHLTTDEINSELVARGLLEKPLNKQGAGNLAGSFRQKQTRHNLQPPFVEIVDDGKWWFNVKDLLPLLEDFRSRYPSGEGRYPREVSDSTARQLGEELEQTRRRALQRLSRSGVCSSIPQLQHTNQSSQWLIADEELNQDCSKLLKDPDFFIDAIRRAGVVLEERIRKKLEGIGKPTRKHGVELVDFALNKESGQLVISDHPSEQEGVHMLFRGSLMYVRNPPSHKKMLYSQLEAVRSVELIDYLLFLLAQARSRA